MATKKVIRRFFPTQYSESLLEGTFETFTKPSMTEPDNAMSIPEIIARFTRGYGIEVRQNPWTSGNAFGDEGDPNDLQGFLGEPAEPASQEPQSDPVPPAGEPTTPPEGEGPAASALEGE